MLISLILLQDANWYEALVRREMEGKGMKVYASWRQEPTLEEVFIKFVGRGFEESEILGT